MLQQTFAAALTQHRNSNIKRQTPSLSEDDDSETRHRRRMQYS